MSKSQLSRLAKGYQPLVNLSKDALAPRPFARWRDVGVQQQQMAIEKPNLIIAAGTFSSANPIVINFQNGCAFARTGAGTYTMTLDQAVGAAPSTMAVLLLTKVIAAATAADLTAAQTSATVYTISSAATVGGAAADVAGLQIQALLYAIGAPGTSGI